MRRRLAFLCSMAAGAACAADTPADYAWPDPTDFFKQLATKIEGPVMVFRLKLDR